MYRTILCAAAGAVIFAMPAKADETLKFRGVYHATSVQSQDVGDVDGHTMSSFRLSGLVSFPDGSVALENDVGTNDYIKGSGTFSLIGSITFSDGSVLWAKNTGTNVVQGSGAKVTGTVTIIGGKGRYEGAKGDGAMTGGRLQGLAAGVELYADVTLNIKK